MKIGDAFLCANIALSFPSKPNSLEKIEKDWPCSFGH